MMRNLENNHVRTRLRTSFSSMPRRRIDRISNLPFDVKENILKCLPLKDAVRTSILSREWRHQWVTLPHLDFGEDFAKSLPEKFYVETIINHVMAQHKGTIVKFKFFQEKDTSIDQWFHLLVNHPIEELALQFQFDPPHNLVPQQVFKFHRLKHLYLGHAEVKFSSTFKEFANLVKLELDRVTIAPEFFEIFISKCPRLEILNAFECTTPTRITIDAPNLKSFEFQGNFSSVFFTNATLGKISIEGIDGNDCLFESLGTESNLIKVFGQLSAIRTLKSDHHFLQFLGVGDVPHELPNNLNNLTEIEFSCVDFENLDIVACVVCLIRSSPNLLSLDITCLQSIDDLVSVPIVQYLRAQQKLESPLNRSLKDVTIDWFNGFIVEMEFLRLLLSGATALRRLTIGNSSVDADHEYDLHMLQTLAKFHRASPNVAIMIDFPM